MQYIELVYNSLTAR